MQPDMIGKSIHVALVRSDYCQAILDGTKPVEARLTRHRRDPFDRVIPTERIYFKRVGGGFFATGVVDSVAQMAGLRPQDVTGIRDVWEPEVLGGEEFWASRAEAKYATMIHFVNVEPCVTGPDLALAFPKGSRNAWHVLPASMDVYPECLHPVLFEAREGGQRRFSDLQTGGEPAEAVRQAARPLRPTG